MASEITLSEWHEFRDKFRSVPSKTMPLGAKLYANGMYLGEVENVHDGPPPQVERRWYNATLINQDVADSPHEVRKDYHCPHCGTSANEMRLSDARNEPTPEQLASHPGTAHEIRVCQCGEPLTWFDMAPAPVADARPAIVTKLGTESKRRPGEDFDEYSERITVKMPTMPVQPAALLQWRKSDGSIGTMRSGMITRQVEKAMAGALLGCVECGEGEPGWDAELFAPTDTMLLTCRCCGAELRFEYKQLFD